MASMFAYGVSRGTWSPVERMKPPPAAASSIARLAASRTWATVPRNRMSVVCRLSLRQIR
jgi:hypothetical protein